MKQTLGRKFTFWTLLKFTAPTIIMMIVTALYTMVDGIFVSNLVNENALSAINIIFPIQSIIIAVAIMLASGGSAVIAYKMGEHREHEARENFSLIVVTGILIGIVMALGCLLFIEPLILALGATEVLYAYSFDYLRILAIFTPFAIVQLLFQFFFVTAGKPMLGLVATLCGGFVNMILDYVFIAFFGMGIGGAALATGIGYCIPATIGLLYFTFSKRGFLHFVKPKFDASVLLKSCTNGSSEMITNIATAVTTFLFNSIMIQYLGENGVAAITIVLYAQFFLTAAYLGFSTGVAPVISYHYGLENVGELKRLFRNCMIIVTVGSFLIFGLSILLSPAIVGIFVKADSEVFAIAMHGFLLFGISYLFTGFNIFASSLFTAFSNGKVSAIISFVRTFIFIVSGILFLPLLIGTDGIWLAVPLAEIFTLFLSLWYILKHKDIYNYA